MSAGERAAAYERYVQETVAALGKPTPEQIRKLQILFDYGVPQPNHANRGVER